MTKSSTEAELVGCSDIIGVVDHIKSILKDIGESFKTPCMLLHQDNQSTIRLINKGCAQSFRSKHINVRYFFLKERIDNNEVKVIYCPTDLMLADVLTKPLQGEKFNLGRDRLLNWSSKFIQQVKV